LAPELCDAQHISGAGARPDCNDLSGLFLILWAEAVCRPHAGVIS